MQIKLLASLLLFTILFVSIQAAPASLSDSTVIDKAVQENESIKGYESFVQNDAKSAGRPLKEEGLLKELKAVSAKLETLQGLGSVNSGSNMKKGGNDVLANLLLTVQKLIKSLLEGLGGERRRRGEKEPSVHSYRKDKSDKNKLETKFEDT